jgi:hypothetical protein
VTLTLPGLWIPAVPAGMTVPRRCVCKDVVSTPIPTFPLPLGKGLCLRRQGSFPSTGEVRQASGTGNNRMPRGAAKVRCMADSNGRQLRPVTPLGTDETGRIGVRHTYGQ